MYVVHFFFDDRRSGEYIICSALRGPNIFKLQLEHNPCRMEQSGPGFCVSENENEEPRSPIDSCGSRGERVRGLPEVLDGTLEALLVWEPRIY